MPNKLSAEQSKKASTILSHLDRIAAEIQTNFASMGLSFDNAKTLVNHLDKVADEAEAHFYGPESMTRRQIEVLKTAKVIQKESDEPYMATFENPMAPIQTDADEAYMSAYKDDQSSAVNSGKSTTGRPLAP
jgi:hypothetical protein